MKEDNGNIVSQPSEQQKETDPRVLKQHLADYQRKVLYYAQRKAKYEGLMRRNGYENLPIEKQTRAVKRLTNASMELSQSQRIVDALVTELDQIK